MGEVFGGRLLPVDMAELDERIDARLRERDRRLAERLREANYGRQSEALGKLADLLEAE